MRPDVLFAILPPFLLCWYVLAFWIGKKAEPRIENDGLFAIATAVLIAIAMLAALLFIWLHSVASSLGYVEPLGSTPRAEAEANPHGTP
jgi:hypothetical protein